MAAAEPVAATVPVAAPPPAGPAPAAGTLSGFAGRAPGLTDTAIGVSPAPRRVPLRQTILATIAEPGFREIILVGLATIFGAAFARRRRRRRIGWGVLPARPSQR